MGEKKLSSRLRRIITEQPIKGERHIIFKPPSIPSLYSTNDLKAMFGMTPKPVCELSTLDDLLERDKQREEDGFPKKIKIGTIRGRGKTGKKSVIVPVVTEEKFIHDYRVNLEDLQIGGTGEEKEGEVIGEIPLICEGEGEKGEGGTESGEHEIESKAYEIGKVLTEKFELPNLQEKGKKRSFVKFKYDLTDKHPRTGQVLDKKDTLKNIVKTNLALGNVTPDDIDPTKLVVDPNDMIYRILSREKDYESEAVVFFIRDYSGSMHGKPTDIVVQQHLFIYAWLVYQYQNRVMSRFILHDTDAKEVENFDTYYHSTIAGGTMISSAYRLVNKIIEEENLAKKYNIYVFQGTDGDDFEGDEEETVKELGTLLPDTNRTGITFIRTRWNDYGTSVLEKYIERSGLKDKRDLLRMDAISEDEGTEDRIIEGIKKLVSENETS